MLTSIKDGGTTLYRGDDVFFQEYTHKSTVLNGWVFALFGLYDYLKVNKDDYLKEIFNRSLNSMQTHLESFDNGYWSMYNIDRIIASSFYHDLHIAQLSVLYNLFNVNCFKEYTEKWMKYRNNWVKRKHAFVVKVYQKLTEQ